MRYLILSALLLLQGCFWQSVSDYKINAAIQVCALADKKVGSIVEYWTGGTAVICLGDTAWTDLDVYIEEQGKSILRNSP